MTTPKNPRPLGSMRERKPGVWELRVSVGADPVSGKWLVDSSTFHGGKRDAKKELARLAGGAASPTAKIETKETFGEAMTRWLKDADLSPSTRREYERLAEVRIRPQFGDTPITRIRPSTLEDFYRSLDLSPASVRQIHAMCRATLNWAVRREWITSNPASQRGLTPSVKRTEIHPPEPEVVAKLIAAAGEINPELACFLQVAATTGARRGELCGLRWSDVGPDSLSFRRAVVEGKKADGQASLSVKEPKTSTSRRRISIGPSTSWVLAVHKLTMERRAEDSGTALSPLAYVFSRDPDGARPWRPNDVTKEYRLLCKKMGVQTRLHDLRHFCATQLLSKGRNAKSVASRLGHASPAVTLVVYADWVKADDEEAAQILDDLL